MQLPANYWPSAWLSGYGYYKAKDKVSKWERLMIYHHLGLYRSIAIHYPDRWRAFVLPPLRGDYQQGNLTNASASKQEKLKTLNGMLLNVLFCFVFLIGVSYHFMKMQVSSSNYPGPYSGRFKSKIYVLQPSFFYPSPCPNLFVQFMCRFLLLQKSALTP